MRYAHEHAAPIRAILGPTNTGKTYLAITRMLGHQSGMIGFPLRLLARENYDRIVSLHGKASVALVTGEEKIIPANPRWYVCTVEAMPIEKSVDFMAIDEIQLCADRERGHIFTDRLLHARGRQETLFLGADTMQPLLANLFDPIIFEGRNRFSMLSYTGAQKLTKLPPRAAIVAFSVNDVYGLAEEIRQKNGGTAVVLGALSPQTRNAQIAMYQSGEVDYLVATDAIGMGLNMDVNHVAFARLQKYDGRYTRPLKATEIGQIAGRAGRHMTDGTFGVTNNAPPLDARLVAAVTDHNFPPLKSIFWRNNALDFSSVGRLLQTLQQKPPNLCMTPTFDAEDHKVLLAISQQNDVVNRAQNPLQIRLLWDVCQIPDFRKMLPENHAEFLLQIYLHLSAPPHYLPEDWIAKQLAQVNRYDGDIDTLSARMADARCWSYIANRASWLKDPQHWQERTRRVEERLSNALHQKLLQRFVDRRSSAILRKKKMGEIGDGTITEDGYVWVEGHQVGQLQAFRFQPENANNLREAQRLHAAATKIVAQYAENIIQQFESCQDAQIALTSNGVLTWHGFAVAKLQKGPDILSPIVIMLTNDLPENRQSDSRLKARLEKWLAKRMQPLKAIQIFHKSTENTKENARENTKENAREKAEQKAGKKTGKKTGALDSKSAHYLPRPIVRGLLFQLAENLGTLPLSLVGDLRQDLTKSDRNYLKKQGILLGKHWIIARNLLDDASISLRLLLYALWHNQLTPTLSKPYPDIFSRSQQLLNGNDLAHFYQSGYVLYPHHGIRVDVLERILAKLFALRQYDYFDWQARFRHLLQRVDADTLRSFLLEIGATPYRPSENPPKNQAISADHTQQTHANKTKQDKDARANGARDEFDRFLRIETIRKASAQKRKQRKKNTQTRAAIPENSKANHSDTQRKSHPKIIAKATAKKLENAPEKVTANALETTPFAILKSIRLSPKTPATTDSVSKGLVKPAINPAATPETTLPLPTAVQAKAIRIDKWLWYARFFKSRATATAVIEAGHVKLNGDSIKKPSRKIRPGDIIAFPQGKNARVIEIRALTKRRGPAKEAQMLYKDLQPPLPKPSSTLPEKIGKRPQGSGRPTKKERRQIEKYWAR